jgi:putative membrane protein
MSPGPDTSQPMQVDPGASPAAGPGTQPASPAGGTPGSGPGTPGPGSATEAPMTDEQIAALLDAANTTEIDEGKVAQTKAKNAEVKAFAKMMVQHHGDAKTKQTKLVQKLAVTPAESDKSKQIQADSKQAMEQLQSLTGPDFDKAYMERMVKAHREVLDLIDSKLLPNTKNAEMKAFITEVRPTIAKHLTDAEALVTKLNTMPAGKTGTGQGPQSTTQPATPKP